MSYTSLKDLTVYDDVYKKQPQSLFQDNQFSPTNKQWPTKTPGLPQYVCVISLSIKTLGYDQLFPRSYRGQYKTDFEQTNFVNFMVTMSDGFKSILHEKDWHEYVTKTNRKHLFDDNLKLFYQQDLDKSPRKKKCTVHGVANKTVDISQLHYKPDLQVGNQDLRLKTTQNTKIKVTKNPESYISRRKVVAFRKSISSINKLFKPTYENGTKGEYYQIINGNNEHVITPKYLTLIEQVYRQLKLKNVLEGTIGKKPKDNTSSKLALLLNRLLNFYKPIRVYDQLKAAKNPSSTSPYKTNKVYADKDYGSSNKPGQAISYPLTFNVTGSEEWSYIYKKDKIRHHSQPKSNGIHVFDDINEVVRPLINLNYITDGSSFPNQLANSMNKDVAKRSLIGIAKILNSALHLDSTIGVAIIGHTDCVASFDYNLKLSRDRAISIRKFLLSLKTNELDNFKNLLAKEGRTKVLGAGMLDCKECWREDNLRKVRDIGSHEEEDCRKITFEFYLL